MARHKQRSGLLLAVTLVALATAATHTVEVAASTAINVHVSGAGTPADLGATFEPPAVSQNGRYIAYASPATNLVVGDANGLSDIFIYDTQNGMVMLATRPTAGGAADGASRRPSLSASGRYLSFESAATNLVASDSNGVTDVFLLDRDSDNDGVFDEAGATSITLVSHGPAGQAANGVSHCTSRAVSGDGLMVVFESSASNLLPGDGNGATDCFLWSSGVVQLISRSSAGIQANGPTAAPVISADGTAAAFEASSTATNLVPNDTNGASDILLRDLGPGTTVRVSVGPGGLESDGASTLPSISGNGGEVAFESFATNLVAGDGNATGDVFVHDRSTGSTQRASVATGGYEAAGRSQGASVTADGHYVAFYSSSSDLVPGDNNAVRDVFIHDLTSGATTRASLPAAGGEGNSGSLHPAMIDVSRLGFVSTATNLAATPDTNEVADVFLVSDPLSSGGGDPATADTNPVTFSGGGPGGPQTEGIRDARGTPPSAQVPLLAGNPIAFGVRSAPAPQAAGVNSALTGDVFDFAAAGVPDEAILFQARLAPAGVVYLPGPTPTPPDTTNNQIMQPPSTGLAGGAALPPANWTDTAPLRDDIDALSFGEDFFPQTMTTGLGPGGFIDPPIEGGEYTAESVPWSDRQIQYREPIVTADDGASFRFSVDPWAIGKAGTALRGESNGFDTGSGLGPWTSPGGAAADVFGTALLGRAAGATTGSSLHARIHDDVALALLANDLATRPSEDDIDALECVGDNFSPWTGTNRIRAGNIHARVEHFGPPGFPPVTTTSHTPFTTGSGNFAPLFISVTRNSPGRDSTAVRSQFVLDGGAAADVFIAVKRPGEPKGIGRSLLFLDEAELGLNSEDHSPSGAGPADATDDLDALILSICPDYRDEVQAAVDEILGGFPYSRLGGAIPWAAAGNGALTGGGMTVSIVRYLTLTGRPVPPDCIQVGFSVSTDAIGLVWTAVDWEAGPVDPPGGVSAASGDIFYATPDGDLVNTNFLWHEEVDLGLDPGAWHNGSSVNLADLSDNLDGLDSIDEAPDVSAVPDPTVDAGRVRLLGTPRPNPFDQSTAVSFVLAEKSPVQLTVHDAAGRRVATLLDGVRPAGSHTVSWDGTDDAGRPLARGIYFVRLAVPGHVEARKVTFLD